MQTAVVTSDGLIAIPPERQERYDLRPGTEIEFHANASALTLRRKKVFDPERARSLLGSKSKELEGKTVNEWLDWLRGPVELPPDNAGAR